MALDLTHDVPRSPFDELGGFPWLPRMLDKARAHFAGTRGEYSAYPCAGDKNFLDFFGLDADALGALVRDGESDEAIAVWVKQHAKRPDDGPAFRRKLLSPSPNPLINVAMAIFKWKIAREMRAKGRPADFSGIDTFSKLIAVEEGHPVPGRQAI
jgi:hypothetical protein